MAIVETDLVFLTSERMDDTPAGGGRMTGTVIPDGQENNLFPDVAPTDRVFGRVRMRKVFAANRSDNVDLFLGAHALLAARPSDPAVNITLFAPGSWTDTRSDARDYIERYLTRGGYWPALLYGNHLMGQMVLQLVLFPNAEVPNVGQTLVLIQDEGELTEVEQYVRVTRVTPTTRTFVDTYGDFQRVVAVVEISDALRVDFEGTEPSRYTATAARTRLRDTVASAAARYYGASVLTEAANSAGNILHVASLYAPLVPNVQTEIPVLDAPPVSGVEIEVSGGARTTTISLIAHTAVAAVTHATQSLNYVQLLLPKPAAGTLVISYRVQGRWYTLNDDGAGRMEGAGAGSVNYATGSVLVTLQALPDINSKIVFSWGGSVHAVAADLNSHVFAVPGWSLALAHPALPDSVVITWTANNVLQRVIDNGHGALIGDGRGYIRYALGQLAFVPTVLPDPGATPQITYVSGLPTIELFTPTPNPAGLVEMTVAVPPIVPGTVAVEWLTQRPWTQTEAVETAQ